MNIAINELLQACLSLNTEICSSRFRQQRSIGHQPTLNISCESPPHIPARPRRKKEAAFLLHQSPEQAYSCVLLTLTDYGTPSHNIKFLRSLAEDQDQRLADAFPRDQHRERAWFNTINAAYVKARYSKHFEIGEEGLAWLQERTAVLLDLVQAACSDHLKSLKREVE